MNLCTKWLWYCQWLIEVNIPYQCIDWHFVEQIFHQYTYLYRNLNYNIYIQTRGDRGRAGPRQKKLPIGRAGPKFEPNFWAQSPLFRTKISGLFGPQSGRAKKNRLKSRFWLAQSPKKFRTSRVGPDRGSKISTQNLVGLGQKYHL